MNTDFRIGVDFFNHPKIKRLKRRHGDTAVLCLLKLWAFTAIHRCEGRLYEMEKEDILDACEWPGDVEYVDSLHDFKLLDKDAHWYSIHNWKKHNSWAIGANKRSEKARVAAERRWGLKGKTEENKT